MHEIRSSHVADRSFAGVGGGSCYRCLFRGECGVGEVEEDAFYAIAENAPRAEVIAAFGEPDKVGDAVMISGGEEIPNTEEKMMVAVSQRSAMKYFLSAYGIGYSSEGEVVSKYKYVSE